MARTPPPLHQGLPAIAGFETIDATFQGFRCPVCDCRFRVGQKVARVVLGAIKDQLQRQRLALGDPYLAETRRVHEFCATGRGEVPTDIDPPKEA